MNRAVVLSNQRRVDREEVFHRTTVSINGRAPARALVVDLSPLGCMVRCEAPAEPGQPIAVALPGAGQVAASVAWSIMGRIGVAFVKPLTQDSYDSVLNSIRTP